MAERGRELAVTADDTEEEKSSADLLTDIADVMGSDQRLRTQTVLTRLASHDPENYDGWTFTDLSSALAPYDVRPVKSRGVMVLRAADIADAINARNVAERLGEAPGNEGVLPTRPGRHTPPREQGKCRRGRQPTTDETTRDDPGNQRPGSQAHDSLPNRHGGRAG